MNNKLTKRDARTLIELVEAYRYAADRNTGSAHTEEMHRKCVEGHENAKNNLFRFIDEHTED